MHEHRCFTTHQLAAILFDSLDRAEHRLRQLTQQRALERFRPQLDYGEGSAPFHYVLGPAGAAVLAAEQGIEVRQLQPTYRRETALALAYSQRLAHTVGINGFFCDLLAYARQTGPYRPRKNAHRATHKGASNASRAAQAALTAWWSEWRCHTRWGRIVRPDGYGRWRDHGREVDFFFEYDLGTETLDRLGAKLSSYRDLAVASEINTPLLFWLPTSGREATVREALRDAIRHPWDDLGPPRFLIATATPTLGRGPAENAWLSLGETFPRRRLAELEDAIG